MACKSAATLLHPNIQALNKKRREDLCPLRNFVPSQTLLVGHPQRLYKLPMHVLLSGASGFLGSSCVDLLKRFPEIELSVVRASRVDCVLPLGSRELVLPDRWDLSTLRRLVGTRPPTHIIHVAALSSPAACERDPQLAQRSNVAFTESLAFLADECGAHMVSTSTDLVFDGAQPVSGGFTEEDLPCPVSVYSRSKLDAEGVTLSSRRGCVVRCSLLYGHSFSNSRGALGWMEDTLHAHEELVLFEDEFRTPVHVADAAGALLNLSRSGATGLWHCGGPDRMSRLEFGLAVAESLGYDPGVIRPALRKDVPSQPPRPEDVSLNSNKLWGLLQEPPKSVFAALTSECGTP